MTTTGLVAERRMIGSMLQEVLRVGEDGSSPVDRIDYLRSLHTLSLAAGRGLEAILGMANPPRISDRA